MITPDDEAGDPIVSAIPSFVITDVTQQPVGPDSSGTVDLRLPSSGTGGSNTSDDITTSTINVAGFANQIITGVTVNLTLTHQNDSDLEITLTAPDGQANTFYTGTFNGPVTFNNQAFNVNGLAGSRVGGTYTLTIDDTASNNTGTLDSWTVTIDSTLPTYGLVAGAPMDQNADGTADENPLTIPFTGLTPGDVYAVPAPAPTKKVTFSNAASILNPPFNQNTLPLSVPGPQILSTTVVGTSGQTTSGAYGSQPGDRRYDQQDAGDLRPADPDQHASLPSQVLSIMGPVGSIPAPQSFASSCATSRSTPRPRPAPARSTRR